jgi:hypothetical protein
VTKKPSEFDIVFDLASRAEKLSEDAKRFLAGVIEKMADTDAGRKEPGK